MSKNIDCTVSSQKKLREEISLFILKKRFSQYYDEEWIMQMRFLSDNINKVKATNSALVIR